MEVAVKVLKFQTGKGVYEDFKREVDNMESFRSPYVRFNILQYFKPVDCELHWSQSYSCKAGNSNSAF